MESNHTIFGSARRTGRNTAIGIAGSVLTLLLLCLLFSCSNEEEKFTTNAPIYDYRIINTYPHDTLAYTEGLLYDDGDIYESTGIRGRSSVRRVDLETGEVLQSNVLSKQFFGEGIAIVGNRLFQLTWQLHVGFVRDKATFEMISEFHYPTEGWGMTYDGDRLIMSDGSPVLYFLDPVNLERIGRLRVADEGRPVTRLNELEYVNGEIYANIWLTDRIVRIDPVTGEVLGWIDLSGIYPGENTGEESLARANGIAYDAANNRLFITGKFWPHLYEIELVPRNQP
jgi:glutamine cyclotransferase